MAVSEQSLPRLTLPELARKATHVAAFGPALLLPALGPSLSIAMALLLCFGNALILPRMLPILYRPGEPSHGALEIILYPAAVLATLIAFAVPDPGSHWHLAPAAAWFCLAVADGCIGFGCRLFHRGPRLPWNARKPVLGVLAGLAASATLAAGCAWLSLPGLSPGDWAWLGLLLLFATAAETAWFGVADNLVVPFAVCAFVSIVPTPLFREALPSLAWPALALPLGFGLAAYAGRMLTAGGALLGAAMAFLLMAAEPWLFLFLGGFFVLANAATRFGYARKLALGIAEARGGRRGAAEVFGAMGMAAWLTPLVHAAPDSRSLLVCAAPWIAKTMDTVASEAGKVLGGATISLRSFQPVPPGSEGGVSLAGTLWGLGAAVLLALAVIPLGWGNLQDALALAAIALGANVFESIWGEWAAKKGMDYGPHTNFLMTLASALAAWALFR